MEPKIIFEGRDLLVLEKPAGWVVNRAESVKGKTLQEWLEKKFCLGVGGGIGGRAGIVHRLDKETSGLLLVAKNEKVFLNLQKQFKARTVKKKYLALVYGVVKPGEGVIKAPVGRLPWDREKFGVVPGGREAETKYKVVGEYVSEDKERYSLIEASPQTGRTHQIRVHLRHLGFPIVADNLYAGRKRYRQGGKWCPRMFLHAAGISFSHPGTGKRVEFSLPLPQDLEKALGSLTKAV